MSSRSVVFKEEDGWELYYTGCFAPHEHYVPLQKGGGDLEAQLDWARAHPAACAQMVKASRSICEKLANRANMLAIKRALLEDYAARA